MISRNYFWMRLVAFALNFLVSSIFGFAVGVFGGSELLMFTSAVLLSAFIGSFNVFEPKVVQRDYEKIKAFWGSLHK